MAKEGKPTEVVEEDVVSLDMSKARMMEPLPADKLYLAAVSAWQPGKSAAGGRKVHYELTVVSPEEFATRRIFEDLSLDNEYTLGRLKSLLLALGYGKDEVSSSSFVLPKVEDILGMQCCVTVSVETSEEYGDRNRLRRVRPASAFKEVAGF